MNSFFPENEKLNREAVSKRWVTDTWQVAGLFQGGHEDIPKATTIHITVASLSSPPSTWQLLVLRVSLL
jgi:hypothetical protein